MANLMKKVKVGKNQPINISAPNNNALKAKADRIYQPVVGNMVVQDKYGNVVDAGFSATELQNTLEDLQGQIGTLNNLTTTAKNNVVAAINEVDNDISTIKSLYTNAWKSYVEEELTNLGASIASIEIPDGLTEEEVQDIAEEQAAKQAKEQEKKLAAMHLPVWIDNAKVKTNFYVNKNYTQDYTVSSNKITLKVKGINSSGNAKLNNRVYNITYDTNKIIFTNSIGTGNNAVEIDKVTANISDTEIEIADGFYTPTYSSGSLVKLTAIPKDTDNGLYGRFEEFPWNSVSFATNAVASNYNINSKDIKIKITGGSDTAGIYTGSITLAQQNKTSGSVTLEPATNDDVTLYLSTNNKFVVNHSGGTWTLSNLKLKIEITYASTYTFPGLVYSNGSDSVTLLSCDLEFVDACTSGDGNHIVARLLDSNNGNINIKNSASKNVTTWKGTKTYLNNVCWLFIDSVGIINMARAGVSATEPYLYKVESVFDLFCRIVNKGQFKQSGTETSTSGLPKNPMFIYSTESDATVSCTYGSPSVTVSASNNSSGKRYLIETGGTCTTSASTLSSYLNSDIDNYFPGNITPTSSDVESDTYAWYK